MSRNIKSSLAEWLSTSNGSRTLEILGFHLCGDVTVPLEQASMRAGIDPAEAVALLEGRDTSRDLTATDWLKAPLTQLTTEIVEVFHRRARYRLVTLLSLSARVAAAHGPAHPHFLEIHDEVQRIARDLVPHMHTEERYLFPYIASLESPGGVDCDRSAPREC